LDFGKLTPKDLNLKMRLLSCLFLLAFSAFIDGLKLRVTVRLTGNERRRVGACGKGGLDLGVEPAAPSGWWW